MRVALAGVLFSAPDLLLLDEPTNYLDLEGAVWLETYVKRYPYTALIVSHDRRLLDRAVGSILELERGKIRRFPGNYHKYVALREERFQSEFRAWKNQRDFIAKEQDFIKKHIAGTRTNEAKGRLKKLENIERLEEPTHEVRIPNIPAPKTARGGELVLETRELALDIATKLSEIAAAREVPLIFKASYDKANRTSLSSQRGPGMEAGLELLAEVGERLDLPVLTDVHLPEQCGPAAEVVDVLQIPAFLCRQTDLIVAAAETSAAVNVKKGQFLAP